MIKNPFITTVVALVTVGLAVAFNPSPEKHRATIEETTAQRSPVAGLLGIGVLTAFISNYHSVGVASYTMVNDKVVTVGAFGMVFLLKQE
jgi:O-antigen/teichoic acid export membrane protein